MRAGLLQHTAPCARPHHALLFSTLIVINIKIFGKFQGNLCLRGSGSNQARSSSLYHLQRVGREEPSPSSALLSVLPTGELLGATPASLHPGTPHTHVTHRIHVLAVVRVLWAHRKEEAHGVGGKQRGVRNGQSVE